MSGERLMPDSPETGTGSVNPPVRPDTNPELSENDHPRQENAPLRETSPAIPNYKEELKLPFDPDKEEREYIEKFRRNRAIQDRLEEESLQRARERMEREERSGISEEQRSAERAARFGLPARPREGYKYEWIHSPQFGEIPVEWPDTIEAAEKHIKNILGRVEIAKSSITEQMKVEYEYAKAVLEKIEVRSDKNLSAEENKKVQAWAAKMRLEIRVRIDLHQAFFAYEIGGSVKTVCEEIGKIPSAWMDVIFELKQKNQKTGEEFSPMVEALQFYEDHGHEFARHNVATKRVKFGQRVMKDLAERFGGNAEDYHWAQNMAERLFRTTGRAITYDYLVVNKDTPDEKQVDIDYVPVGSEKVEWAGGRDCCDYPMSKILRFRENLATSSERDLLRPQIHLLDGVDIYTGDFWSKVISDKNIKKPKDAGVVWTKTLVKEDFERMVGEKTEELITQDNQTRENAERIARELLSDKYIESGKYRLIDKPDLEQIADEAEKQRALDYYEADRYSDRETPDNEGEIVGHIDFRQMERKRDGNGDLISGIEFEETMGDSPWGIWTVRRLAGPEEAKGPLSGSQEAFLSNPNFENLGKMFNTFDYSKGHAWSVKEKLLENFIKYAGSKEIEETGREKYTEEELLAGVNILTGLTNKNGVRFVQLPERMNILAKYFDIVISEKDKEKIKEQANTLATKELDDEVAQGIKTREQADKELPGRIEKHKNKLTNIMLNSRVEHKTNTKLATSFAKNFALGAFISGLKQFFAELGVK